MRNYPIGRYGFAAVGMLVLLVVALVPAMAFAATTPTLSIDGAASITQTTATVHGTINPNGSTTTCAVQYGVTTAYGSSVSCFVNPLSASTTPSIDFATLRGLAVNTAYHARIVATNAGGTATSADVRFTTLPPAPTVTTINSFQIEQTTAKVQAQVNPNGSQVTACTVQFGATTSYGSSVPCSTDPGSGTSLVDVPASLTGLTPNTAYHFRFVVTNAGGTTTTGDNTFATLPLPPDVTFVSVTDVTQTSAVVHATVNPNGSETRCVLAYGLSADGLDTPVDCDPQPGSGTDPVPVTITLFGLVPDTTYHFFIGALDVSGLGGHTDGDLTFTTAS